MSAADVQKETLGDEVKRAMRVLIIDGESLSRPALADVLSQRSDVEHLDSARDALDALNKLQKNTYEVILLDVDMLVTSGIDLLDELEKSGCPVPFIIFVSKHKQRAITAFERHAVDYVLKPFSVERINDALDVAFRRAVGERAARMLEELPPSAAPRGQAPRIAIKAKGRTVFIDPNDVFAVQADGDHVLLQRQSSSYPLRELISVIAEKLRPYGFVRIHRSVLINSSWVEEIRPSPSGEYVVRVRGGKEYTATRTYKKNFKSLAEFWIGDDEGLLA